MNSHFHPQGRSPPPLQHPKPTHVPYQILEPPSTPGAEPQSYMRFTSPGVSQQPGPGRATGMPPQPVANPYGHGPQHVGGYGPSAAYPQYVNPASFGPWGVNDATVQMGAQLGKTAMAVGQEYVEKNFGTVHFLPIGILKHQFNVSNSYVLNKLRIVLFPWRHRPWSRQVRRSETNGQNEGYQPPRDDINSPDLYIPAMAFVTYVLMAALIAGMQKRFHPEVLGVAASKALAVLLIDIAFVKLGCYFLNIQSPVQMVELVSYGGYKFVGTIVTLIAGQILGRKLYWCVFFYCFGATGFFLLRSLRIALFTFGLHLVGFVAGAAVNLAERSQQLVLDYENDGASTGMGPGGVFGSQKPPITGKFVRNLTQCPPLPPRGSPPKNVHDLSQICLRAPTTFRRPDDFSVVMAVGDSITAGAFAEGIRQDIVTSFAEWRGVSYAGGGDPGAMTVPNLIKHYNNTVRGGSVGRNLVPEVCFGPICSPTGWNSEVDRFNAARSGAMAQNLLHEIRDYLVPQLRYHNISDADFKYMSFQVGSNDLCQWCLVSEVPSKAPFPGSPGVFEAQVTEALGYVRQHVPNTVVNLVGVFKVSAIYNLTKHHGEYCSKPASKLPHYSIGCACALSDGPVGDRNRWEMDKLQDLYNERLLRIVKKYQELNDPSFAVLWQPAVIPLERYPIEAVSDVDCFHPSTANHQRLAAGIWNRLTLGSTERSMELDWTEDIWLRCLEADDRLQTRTQWDV
ncbi:hypothetical protein FRB99_002059 [Tulasnella sp. 403]|nr:hypothetical protein FRB99_002059 [Tulasnella sp. 403]